MNFDDLVDELLDRYVVSEVNRTPFIAEEDEEEEDCEDCGCEEDNEEPKSVKKDEKDDSELSDEDTSEDG